MNQYGRMALNHWQQWLPQRYSQIPDPDSFFSELGDQVAQQIAGLTMDLAGRDQPGEGYLGKLGRLNNAAQRAREIVLPEMVLLDPEPETLQDEDKPEEEPKQPAAEWVPMRENPNHPWWQQAIEEDELLHG